MISGRTLTAGRNWRCYWCRRVINKGSRCREIVIDNSIRHAHSNCSEVVAPVGGLGRRVPKLPGADGYEDE